LLSRFQLRASNIKAHSSPSPSPKAAVNSLGWDDSAAPQTNLCATSSFNDEINLDDSDYGKY